MRSILWSPVSFVPDLGECSVIIITFIHPGDEASGKVTSLGKADPIVTGAAEPSKYLFGRVHVTGGWIMEVAGE
jgi:hypothetical protein